MTLEGQLPAAAAALVARGWSRDAHGEDENGVAVEPWSRLATRRSAVGALEAIWQHRYTASQHPDRVTRAFQRASLALTTVTGDPDAWNRADGRTRQDVIAVFDRAIGLTEDASTRSERIDSAAR